MNFDQERRQACVELAMRGEYTIREIIERAEELNRYITQGLTPNTTKKES